MARGNRRFARHLVPFRYTAFSWRGMVQLMLLEGCSILEVLK
jgi:hypothetical protein